MNIARDERFVDNPLAVEVREFLRVLPRTVTPGKFHAEFGLPYVLVRDMARAKKMPSTVLQIERLARALEIDPRVIFAWAMQYRPRFSQVED